MKPKRTLISTGSPFEAKFGYCRAVVHEMAGGARFCAVAGTTGYDYVSMAMPDSVVAQARNCIDTIESTLVEAGFALTDVVRARYVVTDRAYAAQIAPVLADAFAAARPAATLIIAELLEPEMKVEIDVDAVR